MSDQITQPTFVATVRLVAEREITTRLRSKAFRWMFGLLLLAAAAATVLPNLVGGADPVSVAVVGTSPVDLDTMKDSDGAAYFDVRDRSVDRPAAEQLLRDGDVDAVLVFGDDSLTVLGLRDPPTRAVQAFSAAPKVELVDPTGHDPAVAYFVTIAFGVLFFLAASLFGTQIAQSVVEEKATRIVEILLSTVPARALLTGKVLGNSALAIAQIVGVAAVALLGLALTGDAISVGDLSAPILWFVVFFAFGFVMVAALFAATASLVSRSEDIGSATSPVTMLIMIPYVLSFVAHDNVLLTRVLAWLPFSAPISMPSLVFSGDAHWWEPLGSLALLVVTTVAVIAVGERVYRNSLLRTGGKIPLRDAVRDAVAGR
ncbi:ABC transporter permease [Nocardioides terrae]|uniref:ABC transporter permease n=1 Tax=Nocardioides terrae TaxID=574651 RepID=UPI001C317E1B|nr:ABC transporter permease [Nocardioides terrae]